VKQAIVTHPHAWMRAAVRLVMAGTSGKVVIRWSRLIVTCAIRHEHRQLQQLVLQSLGRSVPLKIGSAAAIPLALALALALAVLLVEREQEQEQEQEQEEERWRRTTERSTVSRFPS